MIDSSKQQRGEDETEEVDVQHVTFPKWTFSPSTYNTPRTLEATTNSRHHPTIHRVYIHLSSIYPSHMRQQPLLIKSSLLNCAHIIYHLPQTTLGINGKKREALRLSKAE